MSILDLGIMQFNRNLHCIGNWQMHLFKLRFSELLYFQNRQMHLQAEIPKNWKFMTLEFLSFYFKTQLEDIRT